MTKKELIELLKDIPDDMVVTRIFRDFPTEFKSVEIIDATKPYSEKQAGAGYWYESFYPESEIADGTPVFKIAVLR
jgi:hypothetical protein